MTNPKVNFIGKTLSGTYILHYENSLYYKKYGCSTIKKDSNVKTVLVFQNKIILLKEIDGINSIIIYNEDFLEEKNINIKDKAFDVDNINNYMKYTNRKIDKMYIAKDNIYIAFSPI
jgi:hypothetical protein